MSANITSVTVFFENGVKREEYGPTKKASVSLTASVSETEDGAVILQQIGTLALAKVADLLSAPKPDTAAPASEANAASGEAPARRTRGPNKPKEETHPATATGAEPADGVPATSEAATTAAEPAEDDWSSDPAEVEITDQELLSATSKRAGELGARDPIIKLIASFSTRTEGAPFKVQEIPQVQRRDYLTKLSALAA